MVAPVDPGIHSTHAPTRRRCPHRLQWAIAWACAALVNLSAAGAADLDEATNLLRTGRYDECEQQASAALQSGARGERLVRAEDPGGDDPGKV